MSQAPAILLPPLLLILASEVRLLSRRDLGIRSTQTMEKTMKTYLRTVFAMASVAILYVLCAAPAHAQATRTWVSGVGDDVNPCSRTAPCKTFAGAISKTAAFGEINCLDPGGFGAVTITKSITILCEEDIGHVLVSGTNGINVVLSSPTDRVTLRGLDIDGVTSGLNGISFTGAGTLHVQEVLIKGFTQNGINFAPNSGLAALHVSNETLISNNNNGSISNAGILVRPTSGASANVDINGVHLETNANGVFADGTGGGGAMNVNVRNSTVTGSSNSGLVAVTSGPAVTLTVDRTAVLYSANTGIASSGAAATVRIGNSTIANNVTGVAAFGGSTMQSFKNNVIAGNSSDGTPIAGFPGPGGLPLQ
jgi:hypothetical protein